MAIFYWKGSTGGTSSNYAWNVPSNWQVLVTPNDYSTLQYLQDATDIPSGGDDVYIGGFVTGPQCLSPLIYGGYSGAGNTGSWITNIGGTGATTATGQLKSLTVGWQTGATAKYPFTHIGGGKTAVLDMTADNYGGGFVDTQTPGLTANQLTGSYYDSLTVLASRTIETSPTVPTTPVRTINLNYALGSSAFSSNLFTNIVVKGSRELGADFYQNNEWEGGRASSNTKLVLSGFINKIRNEARPSDSYWTAGNMDYGKPQIYFRGCTFSEYVGDTFTEMILDHKSTAAMIDLTSWYNYPSSRLPRWGRDITILGEINAAKALEAYGLTGGPTGAGSGTLKVQMDWVRHFNNEYWDNYQNFNNPFNIENPPHINLGAHPSYSGLTGHVKIGEIYIEGGRGSDHDEFYLPFGSSNRPTVVVSGNVSVGKAYLMNSEMLAKTPEYKAAFGILDLDDSVLFLGNNADWTFGVTAGATGATAIVGGIFGSRSGSWINIGEGMQLYNKNITRKFMNTTYTPGGIFSSSNASLEPGNLRAFEVQ